MTVTLLNAVRDMLEEFVCPRFQLQKSHNELITDYELVHPRAIIGYLPQDGFSPAEQHHSPSIVVGLDELNYTYDSRSAGIRLTFSVFSPGFHCADGSYTPDFSGYVDLLNLMDGTAQELNRRIEIGGWGTKLPIKMGMYKEQPYPYWYGWLTFALENKKYNNPAVDKFLREG